MDKKLQWILKKRAVISFFFFFKIKSQRVIAKGFLLDFYSFHRKRRNQRCQNQFIGFLNCQDFDSLMVSLFVSEPSDFVHRTRKPKGNLLVAYLEG